jgi:hypothetical protein
MSATATFELRTQTPITPMTTQLETIWTGVAQSVGVLEHPDKTTAADLLPARFGCFHSGLRSGLPPAHFRGRPLHRPVPAGHA